MTNEKILKKAIDKAVKNGLTPIALYSDKTNLYNMVAMGYKEVAYQIIFSHDFAKAFFPKGWTCYKKGQWQDCKETQQFLSETPFVYEKWQYHLMQMVLENDPVQYLEKFLKEGDK